MPVSNGKFTPWYENILSENVDVQLVEPVSDQNQTRLTFTPVIGSNLMKFASTPRKQSARGFNDEIKQKLKDVPAYKQANEILAAIDKYDVLLLTGSTGCGKSTVVPPLLMDRFEDATIVTLMPTRASAKSIASYVKDLTSSQANFSEYIASCTATDSDLNADYTHVLYCTAGIGYYICQASPFKVTYFIIDEAHKRTIQTGQIIEKLARMMRVSNTFKIILMTATAGDADVKHFDQYFRGMNCGHFNIQTQPISVRDINFESILLGSGALRFQKDSFSANNVIETDFPYGCFEISQRIDDAMDYAARNDVISAGQHKRELKLAHIIEYVYRNVGGRILVFVPGIVKMRKIDTLLDAYKDLPKRFLIHSQLEYNTTDFQGANRRIFIATNIAETAITIQNLDVVIDMGLEKHLTHLHEFGHDKFTEVEIDWNAYLQRRGRVGREKHGFYIQAYDFKSIRKTAVFYSAKYYRAIVIATEIAGSWTDLITYLCDALYDPLNLDEINHCVDIMKRSGLLNSDNKCTDIGLLASRFNVDSPFMHMPIVGVFFYCPELATYTAVANESLNPLYYPAECQDGNAKVGALGVDFQKYWNHIYSTDILSAMCLIQFDGDRENKPRKRKNTLGDSKIKLNVPGLIDAAIRLKNIRKITNSLPLKSTDARFTDPEYNKYGNLSMLRAIVVMTMYPRFSVGNRGFFIDSYKFDSGIKINKDDAFFGLFSTKNLNCDIVRGTIVSVETFIHFAGLWDDVNFEQNLDGTNKIVFKCGMHMNVSIVVQNVDELKRNRAMIKKYIEMCCQTVNYWSSPNAKRCAEAINDLAQKCDSMPKASIETNNG